MDKIKSGVSFETNLNDIDYSCVISTTYSTTLHSQLHYIEMSEVVFKKFIFFKYKEFKYIARIFLGKDDSIKHEQYLGKNYYDVDDVKVWCESALRQHEFSIECAKNQVNKFKNYKIVTKI